MSSQGPTPDDLYFQAISDLEAVHASFDRLDVPRPKMPLGIRREVEGIDPLLVWRLAWVEGELASRRRHGWATPPTFHPGMMVEVEDLSRTTGEPVITRRESEALAVVARLNDLLDAYEKGPGAVAGVMDMLNATRRDFPEVFEAAAKQAARTIHLESLADLDSRRTP